MYTTQSTLNETIHDATIKMCRKWKEKKDREKTAMRQTKDSKQRIATTTETVKQEFRINAKACPECTKRNLN